MDKILEFMKKHPVGVWLSVSIALSAISLWFFGWIVPSRWFLFSTILAIITMFEWWKPMKVRTKEVLFGKKGLKIALISWTISLFLLGIILGELVSTPSASSPVNPASFSGLLVGIPVFIGVCAGFFAVIYSLFKAVMQKKR